MSFLQDKTTKEESSSPEKEEELGYKLLFTGLSQVGKSSIIQVVFEGVLPEETENLLATVRFKRKRLDFSGMTISVFDLGGQLNYLQETYSTLRESIFSNTKAVFFVIDTSNTDQLSDAKEFLRRTVANINDYSKGAKICVLAHKTDLLKEKVKDKVVNTIYDFLDIKKYDNVEYYKTSIFDDSIFEAVEQFISN
ncbi:MAG: 50S ribosome-binding GTPase [Candidatus Heimdallarchaeota archaeon]|nr:50S ribosome-binding GTPase [Candidatus Heimdallarchaeota archaeon]MCK4878736.1 50S ribosome-binding GTPase [Candidatus Heimdallarchaeota archaeon]